MSDTGPLTFTSGGFTIEGTCDTPLEDNTTAEYRAFCDELEDAVSSWFILYSFDQDDVFILYVLIVPTHSSYSGWFVNVKDVCV